MMANNISTTTLSQAHCRKVFVQRDFSDGSRIKDSVRKELMSLEQKRAWMLEEIQGRSLHMDKLRMEESRETKELERLKV